MPRHVAEGTPLSSSGRTIEEIESQAYSGTQGVTGFQGVTGASGVGETGPQGVTGAGGGGSGETGLQGPTGPNALSMDYGAFVSKSGTQSIDNSAYEAISFDTEDRDDGGFWVVGSPTRFTIPEDGWYNIGGVGYFAGNATGRRELHLRVNNTDYLGSMRIHSLSTEPAYVSGNLTNYFSADDYIEFVLFQNSGSGLDFTAEGYWITKISTGPQGATGLGGVTGASGVGETGLQGATGTGGVGETGLQGETGPSGVGETGLQGETGISGVTGAQAPSIANLSYQIDGAGAGIVTGPKTNYTLPFGIQLSGWRVIGSDTGSIDFNVYNTAYSDYPTLGSVMHTGATGPYIGEGIKNESSDLSGWASTTGAAGDILSVHVASATGMDQVSLTLDYTRL